MEKKVITNVRVVGYETHAFIHVSSTFFLFLEIKKGSEYKGE